MASASYETLADATAVLFDHLHGSSTRVPSAAFFNQKGVLTDWFLCELSMKGIPHVVRQKKSNTKVLTLGDIWGSKNTPYPFICFKSSVSGTFCPIDSNDFNDQITSLSRHEATVRFDMYVLIIPFFPECDYLLAMTLTLRSLFDRYYSLNTSHR